MEFVNRKQTSRVFRFMHLIWFHTFRRPSLSYRSLSVYQTCPDDLSGTDWKMSIVPTETCSFQIQRLHSGDIDSFQSQGSRAQGPQAISEVISEPAEVSFPQTVSCTINFYDEMSSSTAQLTLNAALLWPQLHPLFYHGATHCQLIADHSCY